MMKNVYRFTVIVALATVTPSVEAQTDAVWNGSFLGRATHYMARQPDDPAVPEVDPRALPSQQAEPLPPRADYTSGVTGSFGAGCASGTCATGSCDVGCETCLPSCACCPWFGGVYGLAMTVGGDFDTYLSYDGTGPTNTLLSTGDSDIGYGGGFETSIGRYLNNCWGIQASYWGFFPGNESTTVNNVDTAGGLYSAMRYEGLMYDPGTGPNTALTYYGDINTNRPAQAHRLTRSFEAHNFELNLIRNPYRRGNCCVHFELLAGFRYLRINEGLTFSTAFNDPTWGNDPNNELHHVIDVENNLAGFQLGGRADRYFCGCWGVHVGTKFGVYNNHVKQRQRLYGGNGNAYGAASGEDYDFRADDDDIAFLGELFAGLSYDIGCCWRLTGGYRAITACGVAQSTSQFPREREYQSMARSGAIDSGDCLLLHGGYFGVEYNW